MSGRELTTFFSIPCKRYTKLKERGMIILGVVLSTVLFMFMSSYCRAKLTIERCDYINTIDRNILPSSTTKRKVIVPPSIACGSVCSAERTCCYASFDRKTKQCNLDQSCCPQISLSCQHGWIQYETKCYFFSDSERSWNDANIICENKDGMLAEVKSSCEKDFLKTTATAFALSFWLGGTDIQNEGDWIWASSQTVLTFDDWTVDAPNNRFGNEHCLAIRKHNGFQWNDDDCSSSFRFICEKGI